MTRGQKREKTLYDRTVVGRARSTSRRTRRGGAVLLSLSLMAGATAVGITPAQAVDYGGFSTTATSTPLKLEIFEPALPLPTEPQAEFDFSYTRVLGGSGPSTTARASAMWPGPAIGEGLKTFGEQLGIPDAITGGGYPVQTNAGFPGEKTEEVQEFFPGMIGRVKAGEDRTVAKVAYSSSDVTDGEAEEGEKPTGNPLDGLTQLGTAAEPAANPLGTLGALLDFDGMTSVSSTDYDGNEVVATATSRIGELRLLGGLITLSGVNVGAKVSSTLDGGAKTSQKVDIGSMTVVGQKFAFGPDGFSAVGTKTPIPGIPDSAAELLEKLGVAIEIPKPAITTDEATGSVSAEALRITLDTKPLRSLLPELPLNDLVAGIPDLPGQANLLKGLLLSLNTIAPKLVLHLGSAEATATTIALLDLGAGSGTAVPETDLGVGDDLSALGGPPDLAPLDEVAPVELGDLTPETIAPVAKGLPPLGSVPMMLLLGGLFLAGGAGWYLRRVGLLLFGGAAACASGLKVGIPDLRKA